MMKSKLTTAIIILSLIFVGCSKKTETQTNKTQQNFGKKNPNASLEILQYGQLVGEWDIVFSSRVNDSTWTDSKAYWRFEYILDGFAIQDHWINYADKSKNPKAKDLHGTNIRMYNPKLKHWQCVWIENGTNSIAEVWKSYANDKGEIILKDNKDSWTITFYNITENKFDWKWDFKQPNGTLKTNFKIKAIRVQ